MLLLWCHAIHLVGVPVHLKKKQKSRKGQINVRLGCFYATALEPPHFLSETEQKGFIQAY